ncbi:MAG: HutD family protein [Deltaproteobacteria bacterium]|nr:HutD family protein [Deltaproteobacteria bacterium]MBI3293241.1 HutD family protein [Deltaproteobacteria bacterium]
MISRSRHLQPHDFPTVPWKNGKGSSKELACDTNDPFRWRLTQSPLTEGGPFSQYPGYDRHLALLRGGPVTLYQSDGKSRRLIPLEWFAFSGDHPMRSEVVTRGEDLNVFTLRKKAKASVFTMKAASEDELQLPLNGQEHFIYLIDGDLMLQDPNDGKSGKEFHVVAGDLFWLSRTDKKELLNLRVIAQTSITYAWIVVRLSV